jgi:protein-tyrosine phosphatase
MVRAASRMRATLGLESAGAVIDLHAHVLPGVDDGPESLAGSLALARAAVLAGTRVMAATPHIGRRYGVRPEELARRVAALGEELRNEAIPLELVVGGELAASRAADLTDEQLRTVALGDGSCVLLECPFTPSGGLMPASVAYLQGRGFRVLLAHPERSPEFLRDPARLAALVDAGALVQVTAASLGGTFGRSVRRYALDLLDAGMVNAVASDAHDATARPPEVVPIVEKVVRQQRLPPATTRYLTADAPRALLDDVPLPRPEARRRRARWRRRRL